MQSWPLRVGAILDHAAKWHGEQEVISCNVEGDVSRSTYRQVHERARLCALALRRLGVRPGDRVATLGWNTVRHLESWYGIMGIGAVCHTLNPRLFDKDLEYIINHAQDCVIMADAAFAGLLDRLAPRCPSVRAVVFLCEDRHMPKRTELREALCYEELLEEERGHLQGFEWTQVPEDAACGLCYTSGTTGNPKGVLYSHRSNFLHALAVCLPDGLDLKSSTCMLPVVPLFHANSWGISFGAPLVGAKLVLPGPFLDGRSLFSLMERERVTHTAGVPTVWLGLMDFLERESLRLPAALAVLVVGGAACPRTVIDFFECKHGVEVRHLWGMTELSPAGTVGALKGTMGPLDREAVVQAKLRQGRPHFLTDMRIVDDAGNELPHDGRTAGNLQIRGPHVIERYYAAETPAVDAAGWFDTGDVATINAMGMMQITDRSKDVIKSGGEWISSIEIENAAVGHPQVAEAAVIGIPDAKWGERPLLVIAPKPGQSPTKQDLLSFLDGKIARWWMPDDVAFVKELPHTGTGKISKLSLRQQFNGYKPKSRL